MLNHHTHPKLPFAIAYPAALAADDAYDAAIKAVYPNATRWTLARRIELPQSILDAKEAKLRADAHLHASLSDRC